MSSDIFQKFRDKFMEEANMLLDRFEKDILELEKDPTDRALSESVFRAMHTIKGISAMYGFDYISEYTHLLENIFQNLHDGKIAYSKEISEIALVSIDHIHKLLADEKLESKELKKAHESLLIQVNRLAESKGETQNTAGLSVNANQRKLNTWAIIINASEQMYFRGINIEGICKELFAMGKYTVINIPALNTKSSDGWVVLLATDVSESEIREVLMFIEDECTVTLVAQGDIISNPDSVRTWKGKPGEPTIVQAVDNGPANEDASDDKTAAQAENEKQNLIRQKNKRLSVDTEKLDYLMYLVSQLITLNSQLTVATKERNYQKQHDYLEILETLSKQFRDTTLEIRLVPIGDLTLRFQRLVRDLAKSMGKNIELETVGTETELDKNTIDTLAEPLMHIIRNCADHGIEMPEDRKKAGKPETGLIRITANYSGNHVILKIEDDGKGIDFEKVRSKAVERGLLKEGEKPSHHELTNFLFMSGFSTAKEVSEVSGRGVGMDIVKKRIAELRGAISVESVKGKGSSFTIKLGQSLSITDTLLFRVENSYFILPLSEIISCEHADMEDFEKRRHTKTMAFNNELIPFIDLREQLNLEGSYSSNTKLIIVRSGDQTTAIMADKIVGEHQAVLKPLNKTFDNETITSSVSQLGDGQLAFLVDTSVLNRQIANVL
jgi:two-component system chemotaxis sensor kinase CheA